MIVSDGITIGPRSEILFIAEVESSLGRPDKSGLHPENPRFGSRRTVWLPKMWPFDKESPTVHSKVPEMANRTNKENRTFSKSCSVCSRGKGLGPVQHIKPHRLPS
jgi:hypothetical protein